MVAPMFFSCDGNVLKWGVRFPLQLFFVEPIVDLFNYVLIALHKWFAGFERFWLLRRNAIFHFSVSPIGVPQDYRFLWGLRIRAPLWWDTPNYINRHEQILDQTGIIYTIKTFRVSQVCQSQWVVGLKLNHAWKKTISSWQSLFTWLFAFCI